MPLSMPAFPLNHKGNWSAREAVICADSGLMILIALEYHT